MNLEIDLWSRVFGFSSQSNLQDSGSCCFTVASFCFMGICKHFSRRNYTTPTIQGSVLDSISSSDYNCHIKNSTV